MAIDQTDVALNLGSKTVDAAVKFLDAIEALQSLEGQRVSAGLTLADFDDAYAASGLKHVNGAALDAIINTSIPAIWAFMTTNNHDDNLQKARP